MFDHDYTRYPELTNTELEVLRYTSPFPQVEEDFSATVVKVHDGDTIRLKANFRDFDFPLRLLNINAPEMNESGGQESKMWLSDQILNEEVNILIDRNNRVGKYGRLLGEVVYKGQNLNDAIVVAGYATPFSRRNEGKIPIQNKILKEGQIK